MTRYRIGLAIKLALVVAVVTALASLALVDMGVTDEPGPWLAGAVGGLAVVIVPRLWRKGPHNGEQR